MKTILASLILSLTSAVGMAGAKADLLSAQATVDGVLGATFYVSYMPGHYGGGKSAEFWRAYERGVIVTEDTPKAIFLGYALHLAEVNANCATFKNYYFRVEKKKSKAPTTHFGGSGIGVYVKEGSLSFYVSSWPREVYVSAYIDYQEVEPEAVGYAELSEWVWCKTKELKLAIERQGRETKGKMEDIRKSMVEGCQ